MMMVDPTTLTEIRVQQPDAIRRAYETRRRRGFVAEDGQLLIIAADHPARGSLRVGNRDLAMAHRADLLQRLLVALARPGVDGVLAAPDVIEDLLLLGALEDKVVIGSMNRAGLPGAVFEIDDRFTAYDPAGIDRLRLDAGKLLLRIDPGDPNTAPMLERAAQVVSSLAERRLPAMVEPFISNRKTGALRNELEPDAVLHSAVIAAGLGVTSAYTWLKLPVTENVDEMERVSGATTLPVVLLGGEVSDRPEQTYARWEKALRLPSVRGLTVGRSLLYPPDDDVAAAVDVAVSLLPGRKIA